MDRTKILIVDDEPINLDFFNVMLTKLGFQVEMAQDGEEALDKIKEFSPDLIMLDNIMPKLSGWKVTKILKNHEEYADFRDIPIIMFSALDDVKDKIEGFELGIEDYITKPFNFSEVLARVRAVLRNRELYKQVLKKEKRISRIQSLNESLIFFTQHLKNPVLDLQEKAKRLNSANSEEVKEYLSLVIKETEKVKASLGSLEDEITELSNTEAQDPEDLNTLKDLEAKFQKHFSNSISKE